MNSDPNLPPVIGGDNGGGGQAPIEGAAFNPVPPVPQEFVQPVPPVAAPNPALERIAAAAQIGAEYVVAEGARATAEVTYEAARTRVESNQAASEGVRRRAVNVLESIQKKLENTATSTNKKAEEAKKRHDELQGVINERARLNAMAPAEALRQQQIQAAVTSGFGINSELQGKVELTPAKVKVKKNGLEWLDTQFKKMENRWRIKEQTVNSAVSSAARTASDGLRSLITTVRGNETTRFDQVAGSCTQAQENLTAAQGTSQTLRTNLTNI